MIRFTPVDTLAFSTGVNGTAQPWTNTLATLKAAAHFSPPGLTEIVDDMRVYRDIERVAEHERIFGSEQRIGAGFGSGAFRSAESHIENFVMAPDNRGIEGSTKFDSSKYDSRLFEYSRRIYEIAAQFRPTGDSGDQKHFTAAALLDGNPLYIQVSNAGIIRIFTAEIYTFIAHSHLTGEQEFDQTKFEFIDRAISAIEERITNLAEVERAIAENREVQDQFRRQEIAVTIAQLEPENLQPKQAKFDDLKKRADQIPSLKSIDLSDFVPVVAKLVKEHFSGRSRHNLTGEERTWDEYEAHFGFGGSGSDFNRIFSATLDGDKIDLVRIAGLGMIDHGFDPVRNSFILVPKFDESGENIRFIIQSAYDDHFNFKKYLRLYEILIEAGLPITFSKEILEDVQGSRIVRLSVTDPRIASLGIPLPPAYSTLLPSGEVSLAPFEDWMVAVEERNK